MPPAPRARTATSQHWPWCSPAALVLAQTAAAMVLLVGAGLLVKSF